MSERNVTDMDELERHERLILEQLEELKREYERRARPLIQRLIDIANVRMPAIIITRQELERLGIRPGPKL